MKIGSAGLDLIKSFEGCELKAYRCPAGVWTIGYGSTGRHVAPGMTITQEKASALLETDLDRFELAVEQMATPCTQNQYDALVSFAFNCGERALRNSTLLAMHKAGNHKAAAEQFLRWNKAGGKALTGLTPRRTAERHLYLS